MARHFPDFIEAYLSYASDNYCPVEFHRWVGLSIVAAAAERKITLAQGQIQHTPNLYVMLVSYPAVGKSTSMDRGVDLLEEMQKHHNVNFRIIPNQVTEAALIKIMSIVDRYPVGESGKIYLPHSSGFFYASEASASALQNTCGDFVASMTAMYDCPKFFRKQLVSYPDPVVIENVCMNMLAGSTFNYLNQLIDERSVMGGFASRILYIVSKERKIRESDWDGGAKMDMEVKRKLIEDLAEINKLAGPMKPTPGFKKMFREIMPEIDKERHAMNSDKRESIMARKSTNLIKVAMNLSVAESNDLIVTEDHFTRAKGLVDTAMNENDWILKQSIVENKEKQSGVSLAIMMIIEKNGGTIDVAALKRMTMRNGNPVSMVNETFDSMIGNGSLERLEGNRVKLTVNSNSQL